MINGIKQAGGISFGVSMTTLKLKKDIELARKSIGGFVMDTAKGLGKLGRMFGGIGAGLTAGSLAWGIKQSIDQLDALNESAKTLGTTTDALSRLSYVAKLSESSQESLMRGLMRVGRATDDVAVRGVREMVDLYAALGLNAKELAKLAPDQQFLKIGEAIGKLNNTTEQLVATQRIFGRSSGDLVNIFRLSREELAKLTAEADKFGITVSQKNAERIAEAKDAVDKLVAAWGGLKNELAISAAPTLSTAASGAASGIGWWNRMNQWVQERGRAANEWERTRGPGALLRGELLSPGNAQFMRGGVGLPQFDKFKQMRGPGTSSLFDVNWRSLIPETAKQIADGVLTGRGAQAQRSLFGMEIKRAFSQAPAQGSFFGNMLNSLMNTGMGRNARQIFEGMRDSPLAQLQRQLMGANLRADTMGRQRKYGPLGDFNAIESGSLASYQQRIRGQQQFAKVEQKQLEVQERMADSLDTLVDKMPAWGIV